MEPSDEAAETIYIEQPSVMKSIFNKTLSDNYVQIVCHKGEHSKDNMMSVKTGVNLLRKSSNAQLVIDKTLPSRVATASILCEY